jgi:micrococcal nuclease
VSSKAAVVWVAVFIVLALAGGGVGVLRDDGRSSKHGTRQASTGLVVRVVDGDTVRVRTGNQTRTVRYIGVDTPETVKPNEPVQCYGKQASAYNRRLVAGRRVRLRFGPERLDRYGRMLAYVYLRGRRRSVDADLIARGYGRVLTIEPNSAHRIPYERLEREARQANRGLWGSCPVGGDYQRAVG